MRWAMVASTVIFVFGAVGCVGDSAPPVDGPDRPSRPLLLIGLDGATWDLIHPWILRGDLPNLERLRREGAWGNLESVGTQTPSGDLGIQSPVVWTTLATGKRPSEHGILGFLKPDGEPYTNLDRRARSLWNILSDRDRSADVVGWFTSWPVDVDVGRMISDRSDGVIDGGSHPPELEPLLERSAARLSTQEVRRELASFLGPPIEPVGATWEDRSRAREAEDVLGQYYRIDRLRLMWTLELMSEEPADLTAVFFKGIDAVSHKTWLHMDAERFAPRFRPAAAERRRLRNVIFQYYAFMDEAIGRLVRAAPRDANIVIVSDHGFGPGLGQPGDPTYYLNSLFERLGWLQKTDDGLVDVDRSWVVDPSEPWEAVNRTRTVWVNAERMLDDVDAPEQRSTELKALTDRLVAVETSDGTPLFESVSIESEDELRVVVATEMQERARGEGIPGGYRI
jgi:predicted AlkP superfamily phosphohydrolase/phosphomutase